MISRAYIKTDPLWPELIIQSKLDRILCEGVTTLNEKRQAVIIRSDGTMHLTDEILDLFHESKQRIGNYEKVSFNH